MCPPGHGVQETDPPILVKVPNAQFEHVSWAGAEVNFPAMQSVHEEALSTLDDLPGAQSVHSEANSREYFPLVQVEQKAAPVEFVYLPASQLMQSERRVAPVLLLY